MSHVARHLRHRVSEALNTARVVVLHGARQSGKTTLARSVAGERGGTYVTLDDEQVLDADNAPGRYLLTGSTNFLTVPTIGESLAGRAAILRLWPLSRAEIAGTRADAGGGGVPGVIGQWFDGRLGGSSVSETARDDYLDTVCAGGYPEALRLGPHARARWFDSYVETVVGRDIVAIGDIRRAALLPRLLRLAAARTATEVNIADWSQRLGADSYRHRAAARDLRRRRDRPAARISCAPRHPAPLP